MAFAKDKCDIHYTPSKVPSLLTLNPWTQHISKFNLSASLSQYLLPLQHHITKLNQKHRLTRPHSPTITTLILPMCTNPLRRKTCPITDTLDDTRHKGRDIQTRYFPRYADVLIHQHLIIRDHIFFLPFRTPLQRIRRPPKKMSPKR